MLINLSNGALIAGGKIINALKIIDCLA